MKYKVIDIGYKDLDELNVILNCYRSEEYRIISVIKNEFRIPTWHMIVLFEVNNNVD